MASQQGLMAGFGSQRSQFQRRMSPLNFASSSPRTLSSSSPVAASIDLTLMQSKHIDSDDVNQVIVNGNNNNNTHSSSDLLPGGVVENGE